MRAHITFTKLRSILLLGMIMGLFSFFQSVPSYAEDDNPAGATGFTYSITFPDNQIDKELGYYKLKMTPGQHQKLNVTLNNPSTEKVTIDVKLNGAKTNQNGVIEYGDSTIKNDSSLKFDFTELVKGPESVELAPGETKDLELIVDMPETGYDGVIAGGVQLMRYGQTDRKEKTSGSKIINQYAYVIGIILQENDEVIAPDLSLNSVKAGQSNYRNSILVNFSNVMPAYLNDMTVEVQITEKGKETVLFERKQTAMRMAPNSFIEFPIDMNGEQMVSGDYNANILVTSDNDKWSWKQAFKITNEEANKFNERDLGLVQKKGLEWKLILILILIFLGCILLMYFLFLFFKKRNRKKILKKKHKSKKKQILETKNDKKRKKNSRV